LSEALAVPRIKANDPQVENRSCNADKVSAFMTKSRSRLYIWARSRSQSRRLRPRLHHWQL